jgi:hypothetical protein
MVGTHICVVDGLIVGVKSKAFNQGRRTGDS